MRTQPVSQCHPDCRLSTLVKIAKNEDNGDTILFAACPETLQCFPLEETADAKDLQILYQEMLDRSISHLLFEMFDFRHRLVFTMTAKCVFSIYNMETRQLVTEFRQEFCGMAFDEGMNAGHCRHIHLLRLGRTHDLETYVIDGAALSLQRKIHIPLPQLWVMHSTWTPLITPLLVSGRRIFISTPWLWNRLWNLTVIYEFEIPEPFPESQEATLVRKIQTPDPVYELNVLKDGRLCFSDGRYVHTVAL